MNCNGHISISEEAFQQVFRKCGATSTCDPRYAQSNLNQYEGQYSGPDFKGAACVALAARSLYSAQAVAAVDANLFGHFMDSLQRYHFMMSYGESEAEAYRKGCEFILNETTAFIQEASTVLRRMPAPRPAGDFYTFTDQFGVRRTLSSVYPTYGGAPPVIWSHPFAAGPFFNPAHLARALHSLQDSFSPGHVWRGASLQIDRIEIYAAQDHEAPLKA